jgi:drug/metabolite transporter (DMT)-like permease
VIAGLLLAAGCALAGSVAVLLRQRGAVAAPTVLARCPVRSAVGLFRSKWWTVGWLVALGAWLLHVGALSLASLSTVQAVISGGLVFLAIIAERFFGLDLGRRQWIGLLVTADGRGSRPLRAAWAAWGSPRTSLSSRWVSSAMASQVRRAA